MSKIFKKYKLSRWTITLCGIKLHRVVAVRDFGDVKKGDEGGYVESLANLSHNGLCWVYDNAKVVGHARLEEDATIHCMAEMHDNCVACGEAWIGETAQIHANALLSLNAVVTDDARIWDHARIVGGTVRGKAFVGSYTFVGCRAIVEDSAILTGNANVSDDALVGGHAMLSGEVSVCGHAKVVGTMRIEGKAIFSHDAVINNYDDFMVFYNNWSSNRYFTWTKSNNMWHVGCFYGTGQQLIDKAYEDYPAKGRKYAMFVRLIAQLNTPCTTDDELDSKPISGDVL
jgi:carbonic anhydrase/acetyltransferase-like protein (isoleucine patch superfamily)